MRGPAVLIAALFALSLSPAMAADNDAMAKITGGFYGAYQTFHPSDGIPDAAGRAKYEPYISGGLSKLLRDAGAAAEKFHAANKDTPPLIEGDLFTTNFEGATSFRIGACTGDAKSGHCAVELTFNPGKTGNPKDKPVIWTDTAYLLNGTDGWRVDDVGYGGSWDFGNKGRLRYTLKMAIADAGN